MYGNPAYLINHPVYIPSHMSGFQCFSCSKVWLFFSDHFIAVVQEGFTALISLIYWRRSSLEPFGEVESYYEWLIQQRFLLPLCNFKKCWLQQALLKTEGKTWHLYVSRQRLCFFFFHLNTAYFRKRSPTWSLQVMPGKSDDHFIIIHLPLSKGK